MRRYRSSLMDACSDAIKFISGCWIIFLAVWIVASISTKRSIYRESRAQRLRYSLLLVISYLLLLYGRRLPHPFDLRLIGCVDVIAWTASLLCVAGLALCIWARIIIGRNWSGVVTLKEDHQLIERGPYRWVRHPIYTGLLMMYLATAIVLGRGAGFIGLLFISLSFWIKLDAEEKLMLKQFPDRYPIYQRRVKRIIPFIV
jgi:protein-S-isoprenylcysteine O-methyltransferase Ste14